MYDAKTIISLIGDKYILNNPNFFYKEVVYFTGRMYGNKLSAFLALSDIFVDQIDIKLVEEQADGALKNTSACFFFKN